jgi:hypothetical protein
MFSRMVSRMMLPSAVVLFGAQVLFAQTSVPGAPGAPAGRGLNAPLVGPRGNPDPVNPAVNPNRNPNLNPNQNGRPAFGTGDRAMDRDRDRGNRILQGSMIIGSPVMLQGGVAFGNVHDFVIGDNGCVEYAVASYENRLFPIPWGVGNFDFGRRAFLVDIPRERIRDIPSFTNISEIRSAPFEQRVHSFFRGRMDQRTGVEGDHRASDVNRGDVNREGRGDVNRGEQNRGNLNRGDANRGNTVTPGTNPRPSTSTPGNTQGTGRTGVGNREPGR